MPIIDARDVANKGGGCDDRGHTWSPFKTAFVVLDPSKTCWTPCGFTRWWSRLLKDTGSNKMVKSHLQR